MAAEHYRSVKPLLMMKKGIAIIGLLFSLNARTQDKPIPYTQADRERLLRVEVKLEELEKRMDTWFIKLEKRMDTKFEAVNGKFEAVNGKFEAVNGRFEQLEKRLDFTNNLIIALLVAIMGMTTFIWWDRKTTLEPVEKHQHAAMKAIEELRNQLQSKGIL
jgi:tetrahydromethanopterin S-methyltransferase subunit G